MKKLTKKTKKSLKIRKKSAKYKMSGGFNIENVKFILYDGEKILDNKITIINYFNNFYGSLHIAKIIVCYIMEINKYFKYVTNDGLDIDYLYFDYDNKNYTVIVDYDNKFKKDNPEDIVRLREETSHRYSSRYLNLHSYDYDDLINSDFIKSFNKNLEKKCPNLSISCGYLHTINRSYENVADVSENKSPKEIVSYYGSINHGFKGLIICLNKNNKCISSIMAESDPDELEHKIVQISSRTHMEEENRRYNILLCTFTILYFIDSNSKPKEYPQVEYIKSIAVNPFSLYRMIHYFDAKIPQTLYDTIINYYKQMKKIPPIKFEEAFDAHIMMPDHNNNVSNNNNDNLDAKDVMTKVKFYSIVNDRTSENTDSKNMSNRSDHGIKNFVVHNLFDYIVDHGISYVYLNDENAKIKAEEVKQNLITTSLKCD
jgi:hypothetical protein